MTSRSNILGYKGKSLQDADAFYAPYVPLAVVGNIKIEIRYEHGHPGGYTDDLGIIADRNQWVKERLPGWYTLIHHSMIMEVYDWCDTNLRGYWRLAAGTNQRELYMSDSKDVMLFSLRWS